MPRLNSCTCRRDRRKCSRSALSRLPNSRLDKADIALPIPTEFGYVTANGPFIHKHNGLFTKTRPAGDSCELSLFGTPTTVLTARLDLRTAYVSRVVRELPLPGRSSGQATNSCAAEDTSGL